MFRQVQENTEKLGNERCCGQKEVLAPNLTESQIQSTVFTYTADEAHLSALAWLKHAATLDVEVKCVIKK